MISQQIKTMVNKGIAFEVAEYMVIGTDHAEIGARILDKVGFSPRACQCCELAS